MSDDSQDQAPQVQMPQGPPPSILGATVSQQSPTLSASSPQEQDAASGYQAPPSGGSRLLAILGAVAKVGSTAMAGIPDTGRPSFVTGLGEGARSAQAANANQQAIKFRTFDDQVRMAELTHQDQKMQLDTQAQQDAHQTAELNMRAIAQDHGWNFTPSPNHGPAVMDHLAAQTALTGSASVPPGSHVSADGQSIYLTQDPDSQKTKDAQKSVYSALAPALGMPGLPPGVDSVPPKNVNMMTNRANGFKLDGTPFNHDELPGQIAMEQAQRDNLAKNGASDAVLKTLDGMINLHQVNLNALDKHAAGVKQQTEQATLNAQNSPESIAGAASKAASTKQSQLDVENTPQNQAAAARGAAAKSAAELAAKNAGSTAMYVSSAKDGSQIAGTSDELTAAGASGVTKLDADTQKKVITARQMIAPNGLFKEVKDDISKLESTGRLGNVASRWNNFMAGKLGDDPDFAALNTHMGCYQLH